MSGVIIGTIADGEFAGTPAVQLPNGRITVPWVTDAPYDEEIIRRFNAFTHFPKKRDVENQRWAAWAESLEAETAKTLRHYGVQEIPADVRSAINGVKRAHYEWFVRHVRAREMAPPWSVVGPANYHKHARPEKARRHEQVGFDLCETAEKRLKTAINRYSPRVQGIVSSDDPAAIQKLVEKLTAAQHLQEQMKAANKIVRNKKTTDDEKVAALAELGVKEETARKFLTPDRFGVGFPSYRMTNNNAEIKRIQDRITVLERQRADVPAVAFCGEVRVYDNVEENRLQIEFPGKPEAEIITRLKQRGFRWAPSLGVWQRQRGQWVKGDAEYILGAKLEFKPVEQPAAPETEEEITLPTGPAAATYEQAEKEYADESGES